MNFTSTLFSLFLFPLTLFGLQEFTFSRSCFALLLSLQEPDDKPLCFLDLASSFSVGELEKRRTVNFENVGDFLCLGDAYVVTLKYSENLLTRSQS